MSERVKEHKRERLSILVTKKREKKRKKERKKRKKERKKRRSVGFFHLAIGTGNMQLEKEKVHDGNESNAIKSRSPRYKCMGMQMTRPMPSKEVYSKIQRCDDIKPRRR